jgi:hypothetical protein
VWSSVYSNAAENAASTTQRCVKIISGTGAAKVHGHVIGPATVSNCPYYIEVDSTDSKLDIYEPVKTNGTNDPSFTLPDGVHVRQWT